LQAIDLEPLLWLNVPVSSLGGVWCSVRYWRVWLWHS